MENSYQDKGSRKLSRVCKFLQMIYQEFQSYSKTSQWPQRQEEVEMRRITTKGIRRVEREDNKLTSLYTTKKRREILSRNWCIRTCNRRGSITRTRWKMETHCIPVKNNTTSRTKLWNIWQRITHNSGGHYKMEIIFVRYHREIWSLDRLWKSQIFQRATQTQWKTS